MSLSQADNLIIQSYTTTAFLADLENIKFVETECFKNLQIDPSIKTLLPQIHIGNRGNLLITLYSMLIIPRELIEKSFPTEFASLNGIVKSIQSNERSNYESDSKNGMIDYIRHIRNAVAHANVEFTEDSVIFLDKNIKKSKKGKERTESCSITIPLSEFGKLLGELKKIFLLFIESVRDK